MIYTRRDLGGGAVSTELTYPRTQSEVYQNVYDVRKVQTINENTPFTSKIGENFVQIIPTEALGANTPEDFRQSIYSGTVGEEPIPRGDVIDLSGVNQIGATEQLISGRYQVQNPKGTISGAMTFGSQEYISNVKIAEDIKFGRWYSGLSDQDKWLFEAEVIAGTTLLTLPLAGAGISMLPRALQLGVAYGSSAYMSYDIIQGTSKEGIGYLGKPQFVIGVPLSIVGGYVGSKLASRYGLAGSFGRSEVVRPTQTITGVRELGDNTGIFRGNVEVKYGLGGGLKGVKANVVENYDVILYGEDLKVPFARVVNLPSARSPIAVAQTGKVDVLILGGTRTTTTRNLFGSWSKVSTSPISPSQSNLLLFNQAEGIAEFPSFTAKAKYSEIASPDLNTKFYGRSLSLSTDNFEASLGISREISGKFDIRTVSLGASATVPAQEPIAPSPFKPTFTPPKSNVYVGLGDLSNQPISPKGLNSALGFKELKAIPLTSSDKSFITSLKGSSLQVQQPVLTKTEAVGTLQAGSFARPSSVSRTSVFDFMPKLTLPSFKTGQQQVFNQGQIFKQSQGQIHEPVQILRLGGQQKERGFVMPPRMKMFTRDRSEGQILVGGQIDVFKDEERVEQMVALRTDVVSLQKQKTPPSPFTVGTNPKIPKIPPPKIFLPFPNLSISLGASNLRGFSRGFKSQYKPTLVAKEFKIYGKEPKFITGLEIRPMLRSSRKKKSRRGR